MEGGEGGEGRWRRADFCEDKEKDERFCLLGSFFNSFHTEARYCGKCSTLIPEKVLPELNENIICLSFFNIHLPAYFSQPRVLFCFSGNNLVDSSPDGNNTHDFCSEERERVGKMKINNEREETPETEKKKGEEEDEEEAPCCVF